MEITYQLNEDEFVGAHLDYWLRIRKRYAQRAVDVVGVLLIVAAILELFRPSPHNGSASALLGLVGAWMIGSRRIWWPYFLRRTFRRSPNLQAEQRVSVDDEGIRITGPQSTEQVRWGAFQKAYETENAFLLLYSPVAFYIVPRRAFVANALGEFRNILQEKGLLEARLVECGISGWR
jgi:YcxB-like protein